MRQLLFAFILLFSISIISCSDSGTGPDPDDGNSGGDETTTYTVSVDVTPSDAGSISPSSEDSYEEGEEIELQANTNTGYVFKNWTGDIDTTSDNPLSITVDQDYDITANYEIKSYELTVNTQGEGSVTEQIIQQKSTEYDHGTVVELTAEPQQGHEFVSWQGDLTGTENPTQITVDNPKEVTAIFEVASYPLSIDLSGEGSVTATPDQEEYEYGTEVELLAEPNNSDWEFESWDGDTTSTDNPITVSVDSSITITGRFANTLFAGGSGTEDNPYQISTIEQLQAINQYPNDHYKQINDIDASETSNWNGGEGFKPIGDEVIPFTGSYNGQNYSIRNIFINRSAEYVGLFGYGEKANFQKLTLSNIDIQGHTNTYDVGGLVGKCMNGCELITINASGKVTNNSSNNTSVGGIFGSIAQTDNTPNQISDLVADVNLDVQSTSNTGGLGGIFTDGTIKNSKSSGIINSKGVAGGLIGSATRATINNTSSTAQVNANRTGGLIGGLGGNIENSYATGDVNGEKHVGGLIGSMNTQYTQLTGGIAPFIKNSYSSGDVQGTNYVGGIVGIWQDKDNRDSNSSITDSYSEGNITGTEHVGGIGGRLGYINVSNTYSVGTISGDISIGGISGEHRNGNIESSKSIGKVVGNKYVGGLTGMGGGGRILNSYSSANVEGENIIGGLAGSYLGNINKSYSTGSITGSGNKIGGLVGEFGNSLSESIIQSYSLSSVSGVEEVGGIVGENNGAKIKNTYSHGNVEGDISVGGLVGVNRNEGNVSNSYAKGSITGNTDVGGLIGTNGATIGSSYWDTESTNQTTAVGRGNSNGTTGLTTSEMTGTSAEDNMPDFDWTEIWVTTENYPALFWE